MRKFQDSKIQNKLKVLSFLSISSLVFMGYISTYFYDTGSVLSYILNGERIQINTFQAGVTDYYQHRLSNDEVWLESAVKNIETANSMSRTFSILDQMAQLQHDELIETLYANYREAFDNNKEKAALMASRIKLLLWLNPPQLKDARQIASQSYEMGETIKKKMLESKSYKDFHNDESIYSDIKNLKNIYNDFASSVTSLITYVNRLLFLSIIILSLLLILSITLISTIISRSIIRPVNDMVNKFKMIARGNLKVEFAEISKNEIGDLATSFLQIQDGLRDVIAHTKKVAAGDYSSQIIPKSDEDELSVAINKMNAELKESQKKALQDSWFKSGLNIINARLTNCSNMVEISTESISFLMDYLNAQLASIHFYDSEHKYLKLLSASGFEPGKLHAKIALNDGIIGQVATLKKIRILNDITDETYKTFSSSGEFSPKQVIIAPLLFKNSLVGVLELASIRILPEHEIQFLLQVSDIIAINLNSMESRVKTDELLQKTQDQAGKLQVQQEELRVANEELTEHAKILQENERKLQLQQEELRVSNEELEERTRQLEIQKEEITNRHKELSEIRDKLEIKANELQKASVYKSEFLANMSHELRTPLNSLLILSNLLAKNKKGNLTEEQVQSIKIIHKSGTDLLQLINEVLDLSKIEAGKMSIVIDSLNTSDLQEEVLLSFKALAEEKKIAFNVSVTNTFPQQLRTDRQRLMQIVNNLLSNAFKFTSSGSISVNFITTQTNTVFRRPELTAENTCCIKVSDTGVGIPPEKLELIFDAFQQADGSISRKFGGTGLGLSISRELVKLLGGEIQLESKVNEGSTFFVFLPLDKQNLKTFETIASSSDLKMAASQTETNTEYQLHEPEVIPFVDDDRDEPITGRTVLVIHPIRTLAEKFLRQARAKNFQALVASDLAQGIILAEKFKPKAIMLSLNLADETNSDYQKLKSHPLLGKLPVHVISSVELNDTEEHHELKTLETVEFDEALKSVESHFSSSMKKMLVVEDNLITRSIIRNLFSEHGLDISEVQMASEAFDKLCNEKFDCVILDLGLPDYSGKELLEKLKASKIAIPKVFVYTAKDMSLEEIKELNTYTDTIILKGLKSEERLMDEITLFLHQVSRIVPEIPKPKPGATGTDSLFKGKKIMVVDDDIRNVFALGQMLEERDIEVVEAENGQVAIDLLKKDNNVDLVLMDVMMPVMDGYEAMRIIRKTPEIKDIPIICLTAKAMKEDHDNALKNGANDYLSKPLNEEKLFAMIKIWLSRN